jgi:hypothetical protein
MKTILRMLTFAGVAAIGFGAKPAEAQVSVGVATPGFALGIGPGAGFVGGGFYPGYPVVAGPVIVPRPVVVAPPIYGRPVYGGYYGRGGYGPRYGPAYRGPGPYYRR